MSLIMILAAAVLGDGVKPGTEIFRVKARWGLGREVYE